MRILVQVAGIVLGGAVLGLALNAFSSRPVHLLRPVYPTAASGVGVCSASPEAQHETHRHRRMSQAEAVGACNSCQYAFVDARGAAAYAEGHVPGAYHLPPTGHPNEAEVMERLRGYEAIVIYDSGGNCGLAAGVADRLQAAGFKDVRLLDGSWTDWQSQGGPAQSGACQACGSSTGHADHSGASHGGAP